MSEETVRETVGTPVGEPTEGPTEGPTETPTEKWRIHEPRENPREPTGPPTEPPTAEWYCKEHGAVTPRVSSGRIFCPVCRKILRKEPYEQGLLGRTPSPRRSLVPSTLLKA